MTPRIRFALVLVAVALVAGGVVFAVGVDLGGAGQPGPSPIRVGGSPLLDKPAPAFRLRTLDGGEVSLADYRGRPVIVNFWASWCIPCKEEFPLFAEARSQYAADGLEILGIVHDDDPVAAQAFAGSEGAAWPMLLDPDDAVWDSYFATAVPMSFFIDREGVVRAVSFGPPPSRSLELLIEKII